MNWNWQKDDWPDFAYEASALDRREVDFLKKSGVIIGAFRHLNDQDQEQLKVDLVSTEALKTSAIEGEFLDRDRLQSSIRRHFGLQTDSRRIPPGEEGIAEMMVDLYCGFNDALTDESLFAWHRMLTHGRRDLHDVGCCRSHEEPMRVVSGSIHQPTVHFEAPPSGQMGSQMSVFLEWFNGSRTLPSLTRAGIAHLYFVCIHPFEDGNGRIGRAIAEKALAQSIGQPSLIALAYQIEKKRKAYYQALEAANKCNAITDWLVYFADVVLEAQRTTESRIQFLIEKTKLHDRLRGKMNSRQEKVLERIFREGPEGFIGGLSAENYLAITKTSRATATRDLAELVDLGALLRTGQLKGTRYWLNARS